MNYVEVNYNT